MKKALATVIVIAALLGGGFLYLSQKDTPAPTTRVERVLPDDRFPQ